LKNYTDESSTDDDKGSIRHEKHRFEKDLVRVINEEIPLVNRWFSQAETIDGLIEISHEQIKDFWSSHHPSQQYVLAFLHAKKGNETKAFEYFNEICNDDLYAPHLDKISSKLKELCERE
jgi:hypothetical protein